MPCTGNWNVRFACWRRCRRSAKEKKSASWITTKPPCDGIPPTRRVAARHTPNRKKILNRGNEPKDLLTTKGLTDTTPSKRTPFYPGKSTIKAKKSGISVPEATGDAPSPAASGRSPARPGKAQGRLKVGEKAALLSVSRRMRKASGFPAPTASLLPLGSAGRPSLPAEPRGLVRGKPSESPKPFRIRRLTDGRAALACYPSATQMRSRRWIFLGLQKVGEKGKNVNGHNC